MKIIQSVFTHKRTSFIVFIIVVFIVIIFQWFSNEISIISKNPNFSNSYSLNTMHKKPKFLYRRQSCSCTRPILQSNSNLLIVDETSSSLCSHYSTLRGFHQRIISISMYGPRENSRFALNASVKFLYQLIDDMTKKYPDWILRIYHDISIKNDIICSIECTYNHVDFCNASSLGNLGSLSSYIPPKIWRFLPVGDEFVDIMSSRDLDSPLSQRELDAVNDWILSNKAWHAMRDNPMHNVPMLGGMWGFRPTLNRTFANNILRKILDRSLITRYDNRKDQTFLSEHVWPYISNDVIAHDSFLCNTSFGKNSRPWPTRRPNPTNDTECFVGCVRPCCIPSKNLFGECPIACRPKNHIDWTMC